MVYRQWLAILMVVLVVGLPAYADRANDAFKKGEKAQRNGNYDEAYENYKQAHTLVPNNPKYFAAYTRARFSASSQHAHAGQVLRSTGSLEAAMAEFQRAVEIDTTSFIAQQELRRTADMLRRQERAKTAPKSELPLGRSTADLADSVELQPLSNASITLRMTANADVAYKTICKLAGINVLTDLDYKPQKITVELTDVTLREALEMVRLQSKTFWRPVSSNTIFVAADSASKRKELEQNVVKTFYLRNVTTPAELQEAGNVVRQILDISRIQLLPSQDAMILRGTPDQMVLAEKILADIDKPKSEVVINVAVMQVSRDKIRNLGMNVPTTVGVAIPGSGISISNGDGSGASSGGSGRNFAIGNFTVSVAGASFTALATDSKSRILQNPEIRALNNEKATLRIGDRVPIATGSFQPGMVGGGGVSPLVSTQFQFMDVGVTIDITPHIHSEREVTLKMTLEISAVTGSETIGGITQPIVGQRRIEHETRLADGEVNLVGGILSEADTQSMSGYPWISKLPILKYLFAQENKERREDEIVFAITPHIIRSQVLTEDNLRSVEVGTGSVIELRRKPSAPTAAAPERPADPAKPKQATPQSSPSTAPAPVSPRTGTPPQPATQTKVGTSG